MMRIWKVVVLFSSFIAVYGEKDDVSFLPGKPWDGYTATPKIFDVRSHTGKRLRTRKTKINIPRRAYVWPFCELGGTYSLPHKKFCDRFFVCQSGQAYLGQCDDGTAFVPFNGCKLLHLVNCSGRAKLQAPKGQGSCPRLNGLHKDSKGCGRFYKCENGTVISDKCSEGYEFDDHTKLCRLATPQELEKCSRPSNSSGFNCPANNPFSFGDHSRHPYPGSCFLFIMCLKEGSVKIGSCSSGSAYSTATQNCEIAASVPGCSKFSQ